MVSTNWSSPPKLLYSALLVLYTPFEEAGKLLVYPGPHSMAETPYGKPFLVLTLSGLQTQLVHLEDVHGQMDHCLATALKESKPVYISVCCNLAGAVHPSFQRKSMFTFLDHLSVLGACVACLHRHQLEWCNGSCFSSDDGTSQRRVIAIVVCDTCTSRSANCSSCAAICQ